MGEEAREIVMAWARVRKREIPDIPGHQLGCPCGCMTKRPYLLDPACTAQWPVRDDPVCPSCGTLLDPDLSCYACPAPVPSPAPVSAGGCYRCGKPGHERAQCKEGKR